ncbi:hypothetical protein FJ365_05985 [Candidatus Dependentiae bacterium]|nr:hypothetical protein [Candidatus Dependentiae bacterium]
MVRIPLLHISIAATTATAAVLAGALWFAYQSPNAIPPTVPVASIEHLQRLANVTTAAVTPASFINSLRAIKNYLVRNPSVKTAYDHTLFSWQRDVFSHLTTLFNTVLLQSPTKAELAKILSLVDAITDEFEPASAGKSYNAEVEAAAQTWRNAMYDIVKAFTKTDAAKQVGLLPLIARQNSETRAREDLHEKILLKEKKFPVAQASQSVSAPTSTAYTATDSSDTNSTNNQYTSSNNYYADDYDYVDDTDEYSYGYPTDGYYAPTSSTGNVTTATHTPNKTNMKKSEPSETKNAENKPAGRKSGSGIGDVGLPDSSSNDSPDYSPLARDAQRREAEKREINSIKDFMKNHQAFHAQKEHEVLLSIQRNL